MSALIKALRDKRSAWVALEHPEFAGLRVLVERPPEADFGGLRLRGGAELAGRWVWGWEGFTEEVFMGKGIGSSDALQFDQEAWAALVADQSDWIKVIVQRLWDMVGEHIQRKAADQKN